MNTGAGIEGDATSVHIDFGEDRGVLSLSVNPADRTLDVISPVTGPLKYNYVGGSWLHVDNRHDLLGILVRDFLRAGCLGVPKL